MVETKSKEEIELLHSNINDKRSQHLESNIQTLRKPNLIIFNVPYDVTTENAENIIASQNPELNLNAGYLKPKYIFKDKRKTLNLINEVNSETRKKILNTKLKIG